ncbi:hypothetical protein [Solitalea koreensis]|uniref:Uncharacterized protein n=1 Tax=Solitalea koreensis TaxID=543615 RepID=A0A521BNH4_9SPHI|nr:hypothetical protein [Solitalea koreensis]SMO48311.1 hypothetical protein SAMN06265350_102340 [Solitalea koreensis]
MYIQPPQLRRLHQLLNATGKLGRKHAFVYDFSNGRTESSSELLYNEATNLIRHLELMQTAEQGNNPDLAKADKMRKKIIAMARKMGWETGAPAERKADMHRINRWCEEKGYGKKNLNSYTLTELPKLVYQFEKVYESFIKSI